MPPPTTGAAKTAAGGSSVRGRTKHEQDQLSRKTVYRPVLDNPLTVSWPPLPASVRKSILDQLLPILTNPLGPGNTTVAEWREEEHSRKRYKSVKNRKGKKVIRGEGPTDARNNEAEGEHGDVEMRHDESVAVTKAGNKEQAMSKLPTKVKDAVLKEKESSKCRGPRPSELKKAPRKTASPPHILDYMSIGINEVTKALETRIRWARWELKDPKAVPGASQLLQPARQVTLIPTAADAESTANAAMSPKSPSGQGRKRLRKKTNPAAFSPAVALKLDSIDYSSLPGYEFLSSPTPSPSEDRAPSYYLSPTQDHPSPRLLVNSETLRTKRAVRKDSETKAIEETKVDRKRPAVKKEKHIAENKKSKRQERETTTLEKADEADSAEMDVVATKESGPDGGQVEEEEETEEEQLATVPLIDLVFVCKPDINPPSLVAHLPGMVAAANGAQVALDSMLEMNAAKGKEEKREKGMDGMEMDPKEDAETEGEKRPAFGKVRLIPLDQGAEPVLAGALGLRRVAAIAISSSAPGAQDLLNSIGRHLEPPLAPWLTPHLLHPARSASSIPERRRIEPSTYIETHIKHLKTTAPLNPRTAHVEKKAKRKLEKEERKRKKRTKGAAGTVYEARDDDDDGMN